MTWVFLVVLIGPLVVLLVDCWGQIGAGMRRRGERPAGPRNRGGRRSRPMVVGIDDATRPNDDFTVVVPIYGDIRYLENVAWLRQYGDKVLLATSGNESPAFYEELQAIASQHGFRVHVPAPTRLATRSARSASPRRATGGTARDTIVRDAHAAITSAYVVCIDADTVTEGSVALLVGAVADAAFDLASVPLTVANRETVLGRLQRIEYAMAMRLRRIMPWLVCGGCHVARREVHADLMRRHSLFFQGNDVELGMLAVARGYTVGHVMFPVPTKVPDTLRGWWRQRCAWAGGEFRVMIMNIRLSAKHPYFYVYGAIVTFALAPLRWWNVKDAGWALLIVLTAYTLVVSVVHRGRKEPLLLVYPLYALVYALVLLPFGMLTYGYMAWKSRNWGLIQARSMRQGLNTSGSLASHGVV